MELLLGMGVAACLADEVGRGLGIDEEGKNMCVLGSGNTCTSLVRECGVFDWDGSRGEDLGSTPSPAVAIAYERITTL